MVILESMKMEIPVLAEVPGSVTEVVVAAGDVVNDGDPLVVIRTVSGRLRMNSVPAPATPPFGRLLTAMVTPFTSDGALDLDAAARLGHATWSTTVIMTAW